MIDRQDLIVAIFLPYFANEETELQESKINYPRSFGKLVAEPGVHCPSAHASPSGSFTPSSSFLMVLNLCATVDDSSSQVYYHLHAKHPLTSQLLASPCAAPTFEVLWGVKHQRGDFCVYHSAFQKNIMNKLKTCIVNHNVTQRASLGLLSLP